MARLHSGGMAEDALAGWAPVTGSTARPRAESRRSARDIGIEPSRHRVLCVAYFFPPLGGVSATRMVSFVRHLPEAGWDPLVLAPRGTAYPLRDPAGLTAVPRDVPVVRAVSPEPQGARHRLAGMRRRLAPRSERISPIVPDAGSHEGEGRSGDKVRTTKARKPRLRRLTLAWIRRVLFFPDDQVLWIPFAVRAGQKVLAGNQVDAIYSTSSPVSSHLVAGILHHRTRIPWVAEFRDPWVGNPLADPLPWLHARLQQRLERWIVSSASRVVFTSTETAVAYERRYPGLAGRWHVVPNGYDAEELGAPRTRLERRTPFRLVYTGTLERPAEAAAFLAGVDRLVTDQPEVRSQLTIEFHGHASPPVEAIAAPYLDPHRLGAMLGFKSFVPRAEVLERVRDADACLVLLGDERGMSQFVPGKLFDYIGLDAPVLAVVPTGEVRSVLQQLDWGVVTDPTPSGVADGLKRLLDGEHRTGTADRNRNFERIGLARALGSVFDEAISAPGLP